MNGMNQSRLETELKQAGAKPAEIAGLVRLAANLRMLADKELAGVESVPPRRSGRLSKLLAATAAALVVALLFIAVSQTVLPTSWLYPIQRLSDEVAVAVHPSYSATVMMRRAQQVNTLVGRHASADEILATLSDYSHEAAMYEKTPHASYAAFEFCRSNLQQAAASATPAVRQAIEASLDSLQNV